MRANVGEILVHVKEAVMDLNPTVVVSTTSCPSTRCEWRGLVSRRYQVREAAVDLAARMKNSMAATRNPG
jgi:hypothetical protein